VVAHLLDGTYELFRHFYGLRRLLLGRGLLQLYAERNEVGHALFEIFLDSPGLGEILDQDHGADDPAVEAPKRRRGRHDRLLGTIEPPDL
jgi:hypothetical protein